MASQSVASKNNKSSLRDTYYKIQPLFGVVFLLYYSLHTHIHTLTEFLTKVCNIYISLGIETMTLLLILTTFCGRSLSFSYVFRTDDKTKERRTLIPLSCIIFILYQFNISIYILIQIELYLFMIKFFSTVS